MVNYTREEKIQTNESWNMMIRIAVHVIFSFICYLQHVLKCKGKAQTDVIPIVIVSSYYFILQLAFRNEMHR